MQTLQSRPIRVDDPPLPSTIDAGQPCPLSFEEVTATTMLVARFQVSVLILGPSGAGKEVLAHRIHEGSPRAGGPFVTVDCGALCETLAEADLFGHQRGAFTGAVLARPGLFEAADGGTVFLDEIGELPRSLQAKLLRVLDSRTVVRLGSTNPRPVDVRFISATNRNLDREVEEGRFREDLLYRLDGFRVAVAPLCQRPGEILTLAKSFIAEMCRRERIAAPELSPEAMEALCRYHWPGNVRELRNVVEASVALSDGKAIRPKHLLLRGGPDRGVAGWRIAESSPRNDNGRGPLTARGALGREEIVAALARFGGNQSRAAAYLGVSRGTLIKRIDEFGLARPCKR
jgi:transcriptional regulator with PAS, ATPase and Fis domain